MIFITVGTQRFPFDRLFKKLDEVVQAKLITDRIVCQRGYSNYIPEHFESFQMIGSNEMDTYLNESTLLITHAGTSSIINGLRKGKKIIVVPRQKRYSEHVDDHQTEITQLFALKDLIEPLYNVEELVDVIHKCNQKTYGIYNFGNKGIVDDIESYITNNAR